MQTIYIDIFILINIFEDFFLLLWTKRINRLSVKYYRLLLGSLTGGFLSLLYFIIPDIFSLSIFLTILAGIIMIYISFGYRSKICFLKNSATLLILSFFINGGLMAFYLALKPNGMAIINNRAYFNISPTLLIILTLIIYFILVIYKKLFKNTPTCSQIHSVKVTYENQIAQFKCKYDSGCNLKEPFSGCDVIVVEEELINNLNIIKEKMRIIPFSSLGGNGIIYGFKANKVEIDGSTVEKDIYIGICKNVLKSEIRGIIPEGLI